ncbi:hypothetical protein EDC96DRAFT_513091 [Choanephora cucurbitarum]|uniref:Integral membrane protein n=1 Tax=Choanephora cucurbitarum TaxID=101091 RepID=A0A1C7NDN3_9FUNG|nr:hypothetical protein EDC96DRAFT_513091 [Choanephora cucurbitarum]OBZ87213.1 hypothetical protein A0J61_04731 [Choanephora cucurbitarum]
MSTSFRLPYGYRNAPDWPSLYWPFEPGFDILNLVADISHSLYYLNDIWRFTTVWCLFFSLVIYLPAGIWAFLMLAKSRTLKWYILIVIPFIFVLGGCIASFVTGSIIGVALAFIYNSGFFVMSTWIPFLWALIHILIVIIGSYSTITTIL